MRRKIALGLVLALGVFAVGLIGASSVTPFSIIDFIGQTATPSNPTAGKGRVYYDPVGKALDCLNSDGTSCTFGTGGGGAPGGSIGDIQFNNGAGAFTNAVGIHSGATAKLSNLTGAMTFTSSGGMNFTAGTTMNFSSVGTLTMISSGAAASLEGSSASLVGDSAGVTITATSNFIRLNGVGVVNQINGSASNPAESFSGTAFTGGSGTTTFPLILVGGGAAVTTWSTAGTYIGFDADSGFTGNFFDAHVNGGASVAKLTSTGALTVASCSGCTSISFPQTVAGTVTSGGIPYFNSTTSMSSSALLGTNQVVLGGGAGNPPLTSAGLSYSAGTLQCGIAGTNGCVISGAGTTSGNGTITAGGAMGTASTPWTFSNAISSNSSITALGQVIAGQNQAFVINGRSEWISSADGVWTPTNNAGTGFTKLTIGPATSSFPALCPSGTTLLVGLANATCTTLAPLSASVLSAGGFTAVSIGTPTQVYNTAQTAQSASVGATTMLANPAADRNFTFHVYVGQVAQGTTCTIAGSVTVSLIYTDAITGVAYTYVVPLDVSAGTSLDASIPLSTSTPTVANVGSGVIQLRAKASTNIQYSTTYAQGTCSSGSPTYSVYPVLEAL